MKATSVLTALSVLCPALALGATHNVFSDKGLYVNEPGGNSSATSAKIYFQWTDGATTASSSARLTNSSGTVFDFNLVAVTAANTSSSIKGQWNISKNGVLVCSACAGEAYGFSGSFKFYGGPAGNTYGYHFSGYVTSRTDT